MNSDRIIIAVLFVALIILALLKCEPCGQLQPQGYSVKTDTITKYINHDPIYIQAKAKVRFVRDTVFAQDTFMVRDTVYTTRAFIAAMDTIVKKDTITVAYAYPKNIFSVAFRRAPDSVQYEVKTITITNFEQRPLWVDVLSHGAAAAIGYGVGRIK